MLSNQFLAEVKTTIQHKERNIIGHLPKDRHQDFRRSWKNLHGFNDFSSAKKEYRDLVHWLGHIYHAALTSLEEANILHQAAHFQPTAQNHKNYKIYRTCKNYLQNDFTTSLLE